MTMKRFKLGYVCGDFGLIDNDKWIDLHSMSENSEKNVQICINKMNELTDENEKLKSTINTLTHDNTKMKKVLNTTKKENEHIKNTIQEAYNNERTHLGKSVLKQLKEAIQ